MWAAQHCSRLFSSTLNRLCVFTRVDDSILDSEIFPCNYTVFRRDRLHNGRHGGGVLLATRDNDKAIMKEDLLSESEFIFIDIIFLNNRKTIIGVFCGPPDYMIQNHWKI